MKIKIIKELSLKATVGGKVFKGYESRHHTMQERLKTKDAIMFKGEWK